MVEWGPVVPALLLGDFSVIKLENDPGWVVEYHHPAIFNYVSPKELEEEDPHHVSVGWLGREKRANDAKLLKIVHVEDQRARK